jgi:transcriptional regulator with XRE-family HTH domain
MERDVQFKKGVSVLRQIREALGLSRTQFGAKIEVEANTVGTWETGRRQPTFTIPQMIAFAKLLKQVKIDLAEFPYDTLGVLEEDEKNEDMARAS